MKLGYTWRADVDPLAHFDAWFFRLHESARILLGLESGAFGEILLMLLALRVRQIAAFVVVQRQAELALVRAEVIAHKVGILGEIDCFQCEQTEALASIAIGVRCGCDASRAGLAAGAMLEVHCHELL